MGDVVNMRDFERRERQAASSDLRDRTANVMDLPSERLGRDEQPPKRTPICKVLPPIFLPEKDKA